MVSVVNQLFYYDVVVDGVGDLLILFWQCLGVFDLIKQGGGILVVLLVVFGLLCLLFKGFICGLVCMVEVFIVLFLLMLKVFVCVDDILEDEFVCIGQVIVYEQKIYMVRCLVSENFKQVVQVVCNWVGDNG